MKKTEQTWEKENLGVNAVEYVVQASDSDLETVNYIVEDCKKYEYILCRIPAGKMKIAYMLQDEGFLYAEDGIDLASDLRGLKLPQICESFNEGVYYEEANECELQDIYNCIKSGVFDTDKVSLDPIFGKEKAGNRFYNWCKNEIDNGTSKAYIVKNGAEKLIGFFVLKDVSNRVSDSLLAGVFDKNEMGLGYTVLYYPMVQAKKEGKKKIVTSVSSNNLPSVKTHMLLGYSIQHMSHVFIKHNR